VAAPVFARVAEDALRHLAVPSEDPDRVCGPRPPRRSATPAAYTPRAAGRAVPRTATPPDAGPGRPAGARGGHRRRPARPGRGACEGRAGSSGKSPEPGTRLEPGMVCLLRLSAIPCSPPARANDTGGPPGPLPQAESSADPRLRCPTSPTIPPGPAGLDVRGHRGLAQDGNQFHDAALRKGAAVVVSEAAPRPACPGSACPTPGWPSPSSPAAALGDPAGRSRSWA
jgi:hypothetical protein